VQKMKDEAKKKTVEDQASDKSVSADGAVKKKKTQPKKAKEKKASAASVEKSERAASKKVGGGSKARNIGIDVNPPAETCDDIKCPFHGNTKVRGRMLTGKVISSKMAKFAIVEMVKRRYVKKYERYEKRRTKIHVHNPLCINAKPGDEVKVMECRKISKTKNFVIIECKNESS